jgi:predicted nucleotidyltransferase
VKSNTSRVIVFLIECEHAQADIKNMRALESSLKPSVVLEMKRDEIRAVVARYPTVNPRVFGSALHGDDTDESDLDILVDAPPGTTLFDLGGLTEDLTELLGIPVDVRTPGDLHQRFRDRVVAEAKPI